MGVSFNLLDQLTFYGSYHRNKSVGFLSQLLCCLQADGTGTQRAPSNICITSTGAFMLRLQMEPAYSPHIRPFHHMVRLCVAELPR